LLEPFGCGNSSPIFAFRNALLSSPRTIGRDRTHLQFTVDKGDYSYKTLMWNRAELLPLLCDGMVADIAFMPRINVWNNETSVQLHAVALHQSLNVWDLRQSNDNKDRLLQGVVRTSDKVAVYVNDKTQYQGFMDETHMQLVNYGESTDLPVALLYDLPKSSLRNIFKLLRKDKVEIVVLLFNTADRVKAEKLLALENPQREQMALAYKIVMESLKQGVTAKAVILEQNEAVSENALLIMEELGFIKIDGDNISLGVIKKSSLDDSPLYCSLRTDREQTLGFYYDNLRLSQHELLRI
jgi:single-stranded-DNA-specific exonuclease